MVFSHLRRLLARAKGAAPGRSASPRGRRRSFARTSRLEPLEPRQMLTAVVEVEPNDAFLSAQAVTVATGDVNLLSADDWLNISGAIGQGGDEDFFSFSLSAPSGVFFDIDARDVRAAGDLNSSLALFDAAGAPVNGGANSQSYSFFNYRTPASSTNLGTTQDAALYLDLQPGTYAIRVSATGGTSGDYRLRMLADSNYSSNVPIFNSHAGAADTLYLDFDGHTATNDGWISGTYTAAPYDFDADPARFSPAERLAMQNTWRTTSEDYSPFNVNVTTVAPPNFSNGVAMRMVITSSSGDIVGQSANTLGVSLEDSYAGAGVNTAFTFQGSFSAFASGGISGRIVAAAIEQGNTASHEFGHTLGLDHFSTFIAATANAIMGTPDQGLNRELWQNATNVNGVNQNDVAVIANTTNTIGYRPDDHGDTLASASALSANSQGFFASGVIGRLTDVDFFAFTLTAATAGNVTIRADVDEMFNNLDTRLRLFNASGGLLASDDPSDMFDSSITRSLAAGTYFVEVRGDGETSEQGQYRVVVTTPASPLIQYDYDFGDAPNSYLTRLANGGPRHLATGAMLGLSRDTEPDGQPTANASGDGGDDDGVTRGAWTTGQANTAIVALSGGDGRLDAWIDFNRDGQFDPINERITPADGAAMQAGANTLSFSIPAAALAGPTFARFRLSVAGGLEPTGIADDGEVEDYAVTLDLPGAGVGVNGFDIVGQTSSGAIWVGRNTGQTFVNQPYGAFDPALGLRDVATADFNGDGLTDIIGRAATGEWLLARNTGTSFVNQTFGQWYEAAGWSDVIVGNFAGDGLPDVIGRTALGQWWLGVNDGTQFVNQLIGFWDGAAGWRDVMAADFDGDGTLDVAGRTATGQWWIGANQNAWLANQPLGVWYEAAAWRDVAAVDFNGDGRADIVGRAATGAWWLGTSTPEGLVNSPFGQWSESALWQDVMFGDYSGDGVPDVVGRTAGGDWWVGETNLAAGRFVNRLYGGWSFIHAGNPWRDVMQGDFNGDGRLDVLGRDQTTGAWWLGRNLGGYFFNTPHGAWDESAGWRDVHSGAFASSAAKENSVDKTSPNDELRLAASILADLTPSPHRAKQASDAVFARLWLFGERLEPAS